MSAALPDRAKLLELVRGLVRPATRVTLDTRAKDSTPDPLGTRFGGVPYSERDDAWPLCGRHGEGGGCGRPMSFILQWNWADCPHAPERSGIEQFFYCHECFPWGDIPEECRGGWRIRRYGQPTLEKCVMVENLGPAEHMTRSVPCRTELVDALPDWDDVHALSPQLWRSLYSEDPDRDPGFRLFGKLCEEVVGDANYETRIGGYARWIQGSNEYKCSECGLAMQLLAQIESEMDADLMWGDTGNIFLFECPQHRDKIAMQLQCY